MEREERKEGRNTEGWIEGRELVESCERLDNETERERQRKGKGGGRRGLWLDSGSDKVGKGEE